MVFDDEISTVPLMREVTILPNWKELVRCTSQIGAPENINLKDTWFTQNVEEYTSKPPSQDPSVAPENNNNMFTPSKSVPHVKSSPARKGETFSEVIKCPAPKGF